MSKLASGIGYTSNLGVVSIEQIDDSGKDVNENLSVADLVEIARKEFPGKKRKSVIVYAHAGGIQLWEKEKKE